MSPLSFFALFAMLGGYSVYRRWWGVAAFAGAMLLWLIIIQICVAMTMRSVLN